MLYSYYQMFLHSDQEGYDCIWKLWCHCIQILHSEIYSVSRMTSLEQLSLAEFSLVLWKHLWVFGIWNSIQYQGSKVIYPQHNMIIQKEIKWPWLKYERKNDNKTLCECKANEEKSLKRTTIMKWANTYAVECSKWQQVPLNAIQNGQWVWELP